jgi:GT2 family glycosyltransferase
LEFSIVVCSLNGERVLPACLASVCRLAGHSFELIVVDNGSTDGTAGIVRREAPGANLLQAGRNLGFAGGNNLGICASRGAIVVLLNDDTEVPPGWLDALSTPFRGNDRIGAVGCKLYYPGRRLLQHAGGVIHANANTSHLGYGEEDRGQWDKPCEVDYVTGAALALRRAALAEVGLLDPGFFPIYFEEVDLQARLRRAGWKIRYEPSAWLVHHESQSQGVASARFVYRYTRNRIRYLALNGFPGPLTAALGEERRWFRKHVRAGLGWPALKAYAVGLTRWPGWWLDRRTRRSVPRLGA